MSEVGERLPGLRDTLISYNAGTVAILLLDGEDTAFVLRECKSRPFGKFHEQVYNLISCFHFRWPWLAYRRPSEVEIDHGLATLPFKTCGLQDGDGLVPLVRIPDQVRRRRLSRFESEIESGHRLSEFELYHRPYSASELDDELDDQLPSLEEHRFGIHGQRASCIRYNSTELPIRPRTQ